MSKPSDFRIWPGPLRSSVRRYAPVIVVLCLGIIGSTALFVFIRRWEQNQVAARFGRSADEYVSSLRAGLRPNLYLLQSLASLYAGSEEVKRHEFREAARQFIPHFQGLQAVEWIPRVRGGERETYEAAARADGLPDFQITERTDQGRMVRASERQEYFPVYFVQPYEGNEVALGFDLASQAARRQALLRSRDSGRMTATARVSLVQETGKQWGFLVFQPVYRKGAPRDSIEDRRANLEGFVLAVFRAGDLVESALAQLEPTGIDAVVYDNSAPAEHRFICYHPSRRREGPAGQMRGAPPDGRAGPRFSETFTMADRTWEVVCTPAPAWTAEQEAWPAPVAAATALLFTGLLAAYFLTGIARTARTQRLALELLDANRQLQCEIAERERAEKALRLTQFAVDHASESVFWLTPDARAIEVNEGACRSLGYSREELLSMTVHDWDPDYPREVWPDHWRELKEHGPLTFESRHRAKDGRIFPVEIAAHYVEFAGEECNFAIARDITVRKRAEEALVRRTEEIARSNAELEQFAYVASHDLQEPLRMVSAYVKMLARRYKGQLDADADDFIGFAVDGAERMSVLINDLLDYSRVATRGKAFEPTDCETVMEEVLSDLEVAVEETGAEVTQDPLPTIVADRAQLGRLLRNLIGNAITYHGEAPPKVHVSAEQTGGLWQFAVRDNGIGIEPQYHDRIFAVFQRLHGRGEYEGTGVGLAIAKKIVERHGGRIWVESEPGTGSTFYFTIPQREVRTDDESSDHPADEIYANAGQTGRGPPG